MPEVMPEIETFARIKVVGVGGAGGAALNRMIEEGLSGIDFVAINTDAQALHHSNAGTKLHIGKDVTRGLGAGADPKVGKEAAQENIEQIKQSLEGADMIFVTFGAGGGTGSGGGPIIAEVAREMDILVVGIVTRPFTFEGERRRRNAETAIDDLRTRVDTLITIPNDRLLQTIDRTTPLVEAFKVADDVLRQGVQGIADLITIHGIINLDFADVQSVMRDAGSALMGIGEASGDDRAVHAAKQAIESPLLEVSVDGARGVLFNIAGGTDMGMHEINEAAETITAAVDPEANIIFGATLDEDLEDSIRITVIATGFDKAYNSLSGGGGSTMTRYSHRSDTVGDEDVSDIDMDLNQQEENKTRKVRDDGQSSDIWDVDDGDELDTPTFVREKSDGDVNTTRNESTETEEPNDDESKDEEDSKSSFFKSPFSKK